VFAELQTAGRGRLGRRWEVPTGLGLLGSTLWRPDVPPARAATLGQAAGLAVLDAIGAGARLKWPNDVLLGGAKCAGILLESALDGGRLEHVVVGIGINANQLTDDLPTVDYAAISLRLALGRPVDRNALAAALLVGLGRRYEQWLRAPLATFAAWREGLETLGREVVVGERPGRAVDVEADGTLVVERGDGSVERVVSGEVSLRG